MAEISEAAVGGEDADSPHMTFLQRVTAIYFEPRKTFEDVRRKGSWFGVVILVSALVMASSYLVVTRVDRETLIRKGLEQNPFTRNMSEEQIQQIVSRSSSSIQMYLQVFLAPVGVMVAYLIVAGVFLLIFVLLGASPTFERSLAVTIWGMGPPSILLFLLGIIFILIKDPATIDLNVTNNVMSNLGIAADEKEHPALHSLLSSMDLFSFWQIYLLALGFSVVSAGKLTVGRAGVGVLIAWGIYVGGKVGIQAIFS